MTAIPTITALPAAPARGQDAAVFIQLADAFINALAPFVTQMNAFGPQLTAAIQERVVNEAATSYNGATAARDVAITARNAAQNYAASVNPANLIHTTGDEALGGVKTFNFAPVFSAGVKINGQTLDDLSAVGVALVEAATLADQRTLLGVPDTTAVARTLLMAVDATAQRAVLGIEDQGGVGAMVIAASTALPDLTMIAFGTTVAGSSLVTSNVAGPFSLGGPGGAVNGASPYVSQAGSLSLGLNGTWRLQTRMRTDGGGGDRPVGLWKRIA